jgi:nitrous oxidase accessory protein NosD
VRGGAKALLGLLACGLFAVGPSPALATHVQCGAILTQDTTLDSDLIDCPGTGVTVAADGVTLDLGGHLIDGIDGPRPPFGVATAARVSGATIRGGRIHGFHYGVLISAGGPAVVSDLESSGNHEGMVLAGATGTIVERVLAHDNDGSALNMPGARNAVIRDNAMTDNSAGISGANTTGALIEQNLFARNAFHGIRMAGLTDSVVAENRIETSGIFGLRFEEVSSGNIMRGNRVSGSGQDGISLADDSGDNGLERNRSVRNGADGFDLAGAGTLLVRNRADRNAGLGFDAPLGVALDIHNLAHRNGDPRQCVGVRCGPRRP